jgi:hypothetical protein
LQRTLLYIALAVILLQAATSSKAAANQTSSSDFRLSIAQSSITIPQGWTKSVEVILQSLNGFSGFITINERLYNWSSTSAYAQELLGYPYLASNGSKNGTVEIFAPSDEKLGCCHTVEINASIAGISHSANVSVTVAPPIASLHPNPSALTVEAGSLNSTTLTVTSLNHFSGKIGLEQDFCTAGIGPTCIITGNQGPSPNINPPYSLSISDGGSANFTVTFSTVIWMQSGEFFYRYQLTLPDGHGETTGTAAISVKVTPYTKPEFTLSVDNPSNDPFFPGLNVQNGHSNSTRITLTSLNNFTDKVNVTVESRGGLTSSVDPTEIVLPRNGTETATLTVSASLEHPAGSFLLRLNATSGQFHHSGLFTVNVLPFFTIKPNPTPVTVQAGSKASTSLELTTNGYPYNISFNAVPSNGISPSVSPKDLEPLRYKYRTVEISLTVLVNSTLRPGSYTVFVTATPYYILRSISPGSQAGTLKTVYLPSQTVSVPINVVSPEKTSSTNDVFKLIASVPLYFYGIAGVSLVAVGLGIAVLRRGRFEPEKAVDDAQIQTVLILWKKV